jgi:hypothetical protein
MITFFAGTGVGFLTIILEFKFWTNQISDQVDQNLISFWSKKNMKIFLRKHHSENANM